MTRKYIFLTDMLNFKEINNKKKENTEKEKQLKKNTKTNRKKTLLNIETIKSRYIQQQQKQGTVEYFL